jgi:nucleoside 2-deoxyribosyltransferase
MRIFIGQAVTGEDLNQLYKELESVYSCLTNAGHTHYCTLKENEKKFQKLTKKQMLEHAFREIDKSDAFLAIIRSEKRSEGLLVEVGYVIATKKKLIVAIKKGVKNTYLPDLADTVIEFESIHDLSEKLGRLK